MAYFTKIAADRHYLEHHAKDVPWEKAVELLLTTKNPRKKGSNYEIKRDGYYLLFEIRNDVLYLINAKNNRRKKK